MNLGDHLERGLSAVGITKQRVSRLLGKPCKCKQRQQRLNELGQRAAEAVRKLTGQDAQNATPEEQKRPLDD